MPKDLQLYNRENILEQLKSAEFRNGYYVLKFYADAKNRPSPTSTDTLATFYLYPSGGTLRDSNYQLLFYDSAFDTYRGFKPPERTAS